MEMRYISLVTDPEIQDTQIIEKRADQVRVGVINSRTGKECLTFLNLNDTVY